MVKIIKEGKVPTFQATCPYCNSVLEYTEQDIIYGFTSRFINCPLCEAGVDLNGQDIYNCNSLKEVKQIADAELESKFKKY